MSRSIERGRRRALVAVILGALLAASFGGPTASAWNEGDGEASLSGTVRDGRNLAPVAGVLVCLTDASHAHCESTSSSGGYSFDRVPQGSYTLGATPPVGTNYLSIGVDMRRLDAYVPVPAIPVDLSSAGQHTQDVVLDLGGRLEVVLTLPDGVTPAAGRPVSICETSLPGQPGACPQTIPLPTTNASGRVTTPPILPGVYRAEAGSVHGTDGYPATAAGIIVDPETSTIVRMRLVAGGSLHGVVRDGANAPIVGAEVSIAVPPAIGQYRATTDGSGRYAFPSLPPGEYRGTVHGPPGGPHADAATGPITITENGTARVDFVLPVVGHTFGGFLAPLGSGKPLKAGRTVPVKFTLRDPGGNPVTDPAHIAGVASAPCGGGPSEPVLSPGGSGLRVVDGVWHVGWKTLEVWAGQCRTLTVLLGDGLAGGSIDVHLG